MCGETETEMSKQNQNQSQNRQQQQSQNRQNQQAQQKQNQSHRTAGTSRATTMTTVDAAAADNHLTAGTRLSGQIRPSFL